MSRTKIIFCVLLLAVATLPGLAAAQESTPTAAGNATAAPTNGEQIDNRTVLVSSSYDADDGSAKIVLRSDALQEVTISDAGDFMAGGVVTQRTATLRPGEETSIEMPVDEYKGNVGVSIATARVLYAEPIERNTAVIGGPWSGRDVQIAAVAAAATMAFWTIIVVVRAVTGRSDEPERIA